MIFNEALALRAWLTPLALAIAGIVPNAGYADGDLASSCKLLGPGFYATQEIPGCLFFRTDVKAANWQTSTRNVLDVEASRDRNGPHLFYGLDRLGPDRPIATWQFQLKPLLRMAIMTDYGPLIGSVGGKVQLETPPRKPNDPINQFNRTGKRALLERASVEFAGVSVGVMPSYFDFTPGLGYTTLYASEQSLPLVAYTHKLDSTYLTLSVEDGSKRELTDPAWGEYRGQIRPDLVGAIQKKFDWGSIKFAAASHPVQTLQPLACCASAAGEAQGWAALAGLESWFDVADVSAEFLVNVGATKGALTYLGVTDYPADFVLSNNGEVFLNEAQAAVVSGAVWWTKQVRTVLTFSGYRTNLDASTFKLQTSGLLVQGALEFYPGFVPRRGLLTGIEVTYRDEHVTGAVGTIPGTRIGNNSVSSLMYVRQRF